jgi:hypothetical protein
MKRDMLNKMELFSGKVELYFNGVRKPEEKNAFTTDMNQARHKTSFFFLPLHPPTILYPSLRAKVLLLLLPLITFATDAEILPANAKTVCASTCKAFAHTNPTAKGPI